jgi:hypothetical protein
MNTSNLNKLRADVAAELKRIDQHSERSRELREIAAAHKAKADAHDAKSHALHQALAETRAKLAAEEEIVLAEWCVTFAAETVKLHHDDPLANSKRVIENVAKLRAAWRTEIDTPINQRFSTHPLVQEALNLQPLPDPMHIPINELHGFSGDWAQRRKDILSVVYPESAPLAAA